MRIISRAVMPDGTHIQLEDWRDLNIDVHMDLYGLEIAAYPIAKNPAYYGLVQKGKEFRLTISQNLYQGYTNEMVKEDYNALKNGTKKLEDLSDHFWNGKKDMWYLGMDVQEPVWEL